MQRLVIALVLLWSAIAVADPKDEARAHVTAADTHFKLGRFAEALDRYSKAYELFPAPALLFNLGQCHRNLKQWERAVFFFKGYLRESPDAPNRAIVEGLIKDAETELAAEAEATRRADEERARAAEAERARVEAERQRAADERRRAEAEARAADAARDARKDSGDAPVYRKWWFWTAVGGVALATGGTAYMLSRPSTVDPSGSLGGLDRR